MLERHGEIGGAAQDIDAVLIATPDRAIAETARAIEVGTAVILHCSGATGLGPLSSHPRHGSIHPLMALPDPTTGARRLADNGWFAVAGDSITNELVESLSGHAFVVEEERRTLYHAAAVVSANHTVALLGQIERLANEVDVPIEAFLKMVQASLIDVDALGAAAALTGPASRGDHATLDAHRAAMPEGERDLYNALANAAQELAARRDQHRPNR